MIISNTAIIAIIHVDDDFKNSVHMQEKGFVRYFNKLKGSNHKIEILNSKGDQLHYKLKTILNEDSNVDAIFVTTSKVYKVAAYLKKNNFKKVKVVGYDLLDENIKYIKNDVSQFLIHQNPKKQVYLGLTYLVDFFIFGKEIPAKSLLAIDIIT
jgi:LacI family transcriptional regulator